MMPLTTLYVEYIDRSKLSEHKKNPVEYIVPPPGVGTIIHMFLEKFFSFEGIHVANLNLHCFVDAWPFTEISSLITSYKKYMKNLDKTIYEENNESNHMKTFNVINFIAINFYSVLDRHQVIE